MLQEIFDQLSLFPGPQMVLGLSSWGLSHWLIWQPLTYFTIQDTAFSGLTFSFFINLAFILYLLWVMGTQLYERIGDGPFIRFSLTVAIGGGIATLALLTLFQQHSLLVGSTPLLLAILTAWGMAFGESQIFLFFLIPLKGKALASGIIAIILLMAIGEGAFAYTLLCLLSIAVAYLYATAGWGWHSPFSQTEKIDDALIIFGNRTRKRLPSWMRLSSSKKRDKDDTIVNIEGNAIINDDLFVEKMLEKISRYGEDSLSYGERRRLDEISRKKSND